ncbi:hypothetical protein PhaeoP13_01694 [Phaeobacter piscinae]|uniref:Uncharacterized protein n=1 Tax=Phaeobacter piscinae TaxID=1580596 RepID=A0AAN1GRD6_9RHOB|nr:hypothetical protein PhaeoP13_01694 [Phaeobacter piscinae]
MDGLVIENCATTGSWLRSSHFRSIGRGALSLSIVQIAEKFWRRRQLFIPIRHMRKHTRQINLF